MINQSFVKVSEYLKEHGIKNYDFMLRQIHEGVDDIDVFNPDISDEEKKIVMDEIQNNVWYFLRRIVRIPLCRAESEFIAHILNVSMIYCSCSGSNVYVQSPRMTYTSGSTVSYILWLILTGRMNVWQVDSHRNSPYTRAVQISGRLPEWIADKFGRIPIKKSVYSIENESEFIEVSGQSGLKHKKVPYEDLLVIDDFEHSGCINLLTKERHEPYLVTGTVAPLDIKGAKQSREFRNNLPLFDISMFDSEKLPRSVKIKFDYSEIEKCGRITSRSHQKQMIQDEAAYNREVELIDD